MQIPADQYDEFLDGHLHINPSEKIFLIDHLGGFDCDLYNPILDQIDRCYNNSVITQYRFDERLCARYAALNLDTSFTLQQQINFRHFFGYNIHPEQSFQNFICTFNGSSHVGRKLLVSIVHRFGWFDPKMSSKNFQFSVDNLDGHLADYLDNEKHRLHKHFFIGPDSAAFFGRLHSFGHIRYAHATNIHNLQHQITQSFLHLVSETMATSYYPYVTEKFLYSVATRGLFLAYAQPRWHEHLERYYGFRRYSRIFDYRFDYVNNPVERLIELMSMIAKFSVLSSDDWRDLYEMEIDTIEYNYDHYFSQNYMKYLGQFS